MNVIIICLNILNSTKGNNTCTGVSLLFNYSKTSWFIRKYSGKRRSHWNAWCLLKCSWLDSPPDDCNIEATILNAHCSYLAHEHAFAMALCSSNASKQWFPFSRYVKDLENVIISKRKTAILIFSHSTKFLFVCLLTSAEHLLTFHYFNNIVVLRYLC